MSEAQSLWGWFLPPCSNSQGFLCMQQKYNLLFCRTPSMWLEIWVAHLMSDKIQPPRTTAAGKGLWSWVFPFLGNPGIQEIGSFMPRQTFQRPKAQPCVPNVWNPTQGKAAPPEPVWHHQGTPQLLQNPSRRILWRQTGDSKALRPTSSKVQNPNCSGRQNCLQASSRLDHRGWQGPARPGHPRCTQAFPAARTNAPSHIWAQQDSLQQTHFYCSRLFLRPRVLEMKGSLLWSWEIRESAGVLCLGGKACELRLGWMLMLA